MSTSTWKSPNYRKQDRRVGRPITDNYITTDWLKEQFGRVCCDCGDCLRYDVKDGRIESNLSADRAYNAEGHHLNNVVPNCVARNQRKSCWRVDCSEVIIYYRETTNNTNAKTNESCALVQSHRGTSSYLLVSFFVCVGEVRIDALIELQPR